MHLSATVEDDQLVIHLREGDVQTTVSAPSVSGGAMTLRRAVDDAAATGHGECFWPAPVGHYWWMFRRDDETVEVAVMWSRGGASLWEHVFRATDAFAWLQQRLDEELPRPVDAANPQIPDS